VQASQSWVGTLSSSRYVGGLAYPHRYSEAFDPTGSAVLSSGTGTVWHSWEQEKGMVSKLGADQRGASGPDESTQRQVDS
jgi:hypothetical protein